MDKRYEEALERAKMILCNLPEGSSSARDIETIFPELMGDEEMLEFMRNHFYNLVKRQDENERMYTRCLVYIDKLKEQKPVEKPKWYDSMDEFYADALIEMVEKSDLIDRDKKNRLVWIEKRRAKPAEWSEEDKKMLGKKVKLWWRNIKNEYRRNKRNDALCARLTKIAV